MLHEPPESPEELIDAIYDQIKYDPDFDHLRCGASNPFVPGEGAYVGARAYILGEAPGAHEAIKLRPFVGPAGKIQHELMQFAQLFAVPWHTAIQDFPANCWLTNVLHYRPPRNRRPTTPEIKASRKYIRREWMAVGSPKLIIPVGGAALEALLGHPVSILKASGTPMVRQTSQGREVVLWPMIHPSFGLRNKAIQPLIERDWQKLAEWIRDQNR